MTMENMRPSADVTEKNPIHKRFVMCYLFLHKWWELYRARSGLINLLRYNKENNALSFCWLEIEKKKVEDRKTKVLIKEALKTALFYLEVSVFALHISMYKKLFR